MKVRALYTNVRLSEKKIPFHIIIILLKGIKIEKKWIETKIIPLK